MASSKQTDLLAEPVEPDELKELLSRLAATEAIFAEPQTTIRDVAEATDASPLLIGRILREMRGPDRVEVLASQMQAFDQRLRDLERKAVTPRPPLQVQSPKPVATVQQPARDEEKSWSEVKGWFEMYHEAPKYESDLSNEAWSYVIFVIIIVVLLLIVVSTNR